MTEDVWFGCHEESSSTYVCEASPAQITRLVEPNEPVRRAAPGRFNGLAIERLRWDFKRAVQKPQRTAPT